MCTACKMTSSSERGQPLYIKKTKAGSQSMSIIRRLHRISDPHCRGYSIARMNYIIHGRRRNTNRSCKGVFTVFLLTKNVVQWVAALKRKYWQSTEYSWLCSSHFIFIFYEISLITDIYIYGLIHKIVIIVLQCMHIHTYTHTHKNIILIIMLIGREISACTCRNFPQNWLPLSQKVAIQSLKKGVRC